MTAPPFVDTPEKAAHDLDVYWRQWLAEQREHDLATWHRAEDRYHVLEVSRVCLNRVSSPAR